MRGATSLVGRTFFCLALALAAPLASAKQAVTWIENYDEAVAVARNTGKPIFLEFRCAP